MKARDIKKMVEQHGLSLVSLDQRTHIKARVRNERGTEYVVIFPCSMGDNARGWKNKAAQLKQIARGV